MKREVPLIIFVLPDLSIGGAQGVVLKLIRLLDPAKFCIHLLVVNPEGPLTEEVPEHVTLKLLNKARTRSASFEILAYLHSQKPDLVFSTFNHLNLLLLFYKKILGNLRVVVREANMPSANIFRSQLPWAAKLAYRRLYCTADAVIATSVRMRKEFEQLNIPGELIVDIANPIFEEELRRNVCSVIRHPGAGRRFVAVGRLVPQKGFDRLISLMEGLPRDAHCYILGDGPERSALERLITNCGLRERISMMGLVQDPVPYLVGADAFVMTSRFEGMPNSALEALALGVPVIATPESGGIAEIETVVTAPMGAEFRDAMMSCPSALGHERRSSLLPNHHLAVRVSEQIYALFAQLTACHSKQ